MVGQLPARSSHGGDTATHPESPQAGTLVTRPRLFVVAVRAQALAQQRCPQSARLHRDAVWTLCVVVAVSWPLVLWRAPSPLVGPSPLSFLFFSVVHFLSFMSWCALACSTLSSFKLPAPPTRWCRVIRPACMHAPTPLRAQGGTGRVGVGACFTTSTLPVASLRPGPLVPPFVNRRHLTPLLPACVAHPLPPTPTSTPFFLVARTSVLFHCPVWVFFLCVKGPLSMCILLVLGPPPPSPLWKFCLPMSHSFPTPLRRGARRFRSCSSTSPANSPPAKSSYLPLTICPK